MVNEIEMFVALRTYYDRGPRDSAGVLLAAIETGFFKRDDLPALARETIGAACLAPNINRITGPKVGTLKIPTINTFGTDVSNDAVSFGARSSQTIPERNFSLRKARLLISVLKPVPAITVSVSIVSVPWEPATTNLTRPLVAFAHSMVRPVSNSALLARRSTSQRTVRLPVGFQDPCACLDAGYRVGMGLARLS
jgi:hypothetical protein